MTRRNDVGEWDRMCVECGEVFFYDQKPGNIPDYCGNACKQRAYRARKQGRRSDIEIVTRINVTTQEISLSLNGGKYLLTVDDATVLLERLIKARGLLTAKQGQF